MCRTVTDWLWWFRAVRRLVAVVGRWVRLWLFDRRTRTCVFRTGVRLLKV